MTQVEQRLYAMEKVIALVADRFEIIEQIQDCRVLFGQLQRSLT